MTSFEPNSKESKEAHIKVYARAHQDLNKSEIYEHFKGTKYATRKTVLLKYIREERKENPVSPAKREKSVPVKYRKVAEKTEKERPKGHDYRHKIDAPPRSTTRKIRTVLDRMEALPDSYSIAHVNVGLSSYHIKFDTVSSYHFQLNKLASRYHFSADNTKVKFDGPYPYKGYYFVTPAFEQEMKRRGVW